MRQLQCLSWVLIASLMFKKDKLYEIYILLYGKLVYLTAETLSPEILWTPICLGNNAHKFT